MQHFFNIVNTCILDMLTCKFGYFHFRISMSVSYVKVIRSRSWSHVSVCPVWALSFECHDRNFMFWYASTSLEYLYHSWISRSYMSYIHIHLGGLPSPERRSYSVGVCGSIQFVYSDKWLQEAGMVVGSRWHLQSSTRLLQNWCQVWRRRCRNSHSAVFIPETFSTKEPPGIWSRRGWWFGQSYLLVTMLIISLVWDCYC